MADVYKAKKDVSIPRAIRDAEELTDGSKLYETEGVNYPAGSFILSKNVSPPVLERIENGELEDFVEEASSEEAEAALSLGEDPQLYGTFIPEHEVDAYYMNLHGHDVVPRDQVLEMKSAGAEAYKDNLEAAKEQGLDERPYLSATDTPSLAEVSRGEAENVPQTSEPVEVPDTVEQPPGLPVGKVLAGAEGGEEAQQSAESQHEGTQRKGRRAKREQDKPSSPGETTQGDE